MAVAVGCVRRRDHSHALVAADERGGAAPPLPPSIETPPPLLLQVLAGNAVTAVPVLACLNTIDATKLRRLHPALAVAVAEVPWADAATPVHDAARWRAALPATTSLKLDPTAWLYRKSVFAALGGVAMLDLGGCRSVIPVDAVVALLPPTLRALNVACCNLSEHASFTHLPALESLDCSITCAVMAGLACLPPSLRELRMRQCWLPDTTDFSHLTRLRVVTLTAVENPLNSASVASLPPSLEELDISCEDYDLLSEWSLMHLTRLRVLKAPFTDITDAAIARLPPSLNELDLGGCWELTSGVSFAHLTCLRTLSLCDTRTPISSAMLATLPASLVSLNLRGSIHTGSNREMLTPATVFPALPALRVLNVNDTSLDDAAIASMPAGLEELSMVRCHNVTQCASLDHLTGIRVLQSAGTDLSPATLAACRTRGCFAPADGTLAHKDRLIEALVALPDGRLVIDTYSSVALCAVAVGSTAVVAELGLCDWHVTALAVLHDDHRVAVGTSKYQYQHVAHHGIVVWDTRDAPHDKRDVTGVTIACDANISALAVAHNGWLVAGCGDGKLRVVDVDAGAVMATLGAHAAAVTAVAVLLDGRVASGTCNVHLWDLDTEECLSTLEGHTYAINSLVVLPDGRLASGSSDRTVRLWDTSSGACVRVLTGHTSEVQALAVLPGNQLASLSDDNSIRVWDTHSDASGAGGALARPPLIIARCARYLHRKALLPLPDNRLATGDSHDVHLWQLPLCST